MQHINAYVFFFLGGTIKECQDHVALPIKLWIVAAQVAVESLDALLVGAGFQFKLEESSVAASNLRFYLSVPLQKHQQDGEASLTAEEARNLTVAISAFDHALNVELGRAPIFHVTPKGAYDTRRLIVNASLMYEGYLDRLPQETINDTNQAGRCLAFDLNTAAGFHIARATEAVIKKYMAAHGCSAPKESQRNWGIYVKALTEKGANPIIVHHIDQLRQLHRNPVTHPEVNLTRPAAIALQAMCQSVIQSMVADMETRLPTPDPAIVEMLPPEPEATDEGATAKEGA